MAPHVWYHGRAEDEGGAVRYTVDERHERILQLLRTAGTLRVSDLAEQLQLSTVTLRRDVEQLAQQGRLVRVRGSVSWPGASGAPQPARPAATGLVVGMLVPQARHYFGDMIRGAQDAVTALGGRLVLGFTGYDTAQDAVQVQRMIEAGADGLLLAPSWVDSPDAVGTAWMDVSVPAVLVERRGIPGTAAAELDRVASDHAAGAGLALRHLAGLGHERIGLVTGISSTQVQVRAGYDAALVALGQAVPMPPIETNPGDVVPERIEAVVDELAAAVKKRRITAVLVVGDVEALMIIPALRHRGVRVPEDLALVAYDDDVAALSDLPVTAVAPPKYAVGESAVELLLQRVHGTGAGPRRHLDLLPELRLRESCGRLLR